jgi:hypothetical protein
MIAALQKQADRPQVRRIPINAGRRSHGCRTKTAGTEVSGVASAGKRHAMALGLRP